ncbi:MAG: hypothetical protein ACXW1S_03190, partial [Acidimicrobiia bacterium]
HPRTPNRVVVAPARTAVAAEPPAVGSSPARQERVRRARWTTVGFIALALVPLAGVFVATIDQWDAYRAIADDALIELQTRDVGTRAVFLGPYSRFGWYHPGPALFYVLVVPYRLLGSSLIALSLTALAINAASVVAIGWIGKRRGGLVLAALLLFGTVLLLGGLGGTVLRDVWNPTITVLPLAVLVLVVWSALEGDGWALPVAAGIGSFLVQSHVGYAGAVGVLLIWGLGGTIVASRRSDRALVPTLVGAAGVLAVMWSLPLIEQFTSHPGNLGLVLKFAREPEAPHHVLRDGWLVVARALSWRMPWVTGATSVNPFIGEVSLAGGPAVPVGLLALAGGGVLAAYRREWSAMRFDLTVGLALSAAVISFGRISGPMFPYLVVWVWGLAMLAWIAAAWSAWCSVPSSVRGRGTRVVVLVLGCALGIVSLVVAFDVGSAEPAGAPEVAATRTFSKAARDAVSEGRGPAVIDAAGGLRIRSIGAGVALELERHGIPIEVPPELGLAFGDDRVDDDGRARARLLVATPAQVADTPGAERWELLARTRLRPLQGDGAGDDVGIYRLLGDPNEPVAEPSGRVAVAE